MKEGMDIIRTHLNGKTWLLLTLGEAVDEIARQTSAEEFDSRLGIVAALCQGQQIEAGLYTYKCLDPEERIA